MEALYLLIPLSVVLVFVALWIFSMLPTTASSTTWSARRCASCKTTTSRPSITSDPADFDLYQGFLSFS